MNNYYIDTDSNNKEIAIFISYKYGISKRKAKNVLHKLLLDVNYCKKGVNKKYGKKEIL